MDPQRWQHIQALFEAAIDLNPASRVALLDADCPDFEIRQEVEALLGNAQMAASYFDASLGALAGQFVEASAEPEPGERIGAYRIIRRIGQGGMGSVFLGVRADQEFDMKVAIKVMRGGIATPALIEQFRLERQILARLEHPHIARLLDGGVNEAGLPYVVMEYIEGQPITQYFDQTNATIAERLRLFCQLCSAVHHAHQRLVVHRDIKPGNIFVTSAGIPKLLDFGVARLVEGDGETGATSNLIGRVMTPEYASPEQVLGEKVTTSSDIYSLGVLLTELLAGRTPFRGSARGIASGPIPHKFDPIAPSRLLQTGTGAEIARVRATTPAKLRRVLRGDLDIIAETAMRREPDRRYSSADQLSSDIQRYLHGLPIAARPDSWGYRALKYLKRRRYAVAAGVIVLGALFASVVLAFHRQQETARRLAGIIAHTQTAQTTVLDGIQDLPGSLGLRRELIEQEFQELREVLQEVPGDERALENYAHLLRRSAYLHYGVGRQHIGDSTTAITQAKEALDRSAALVQRDPSADRLLDLVHVHAQLEDLLVFTRRDFRGADQLLDREEELLQQVARLNTSTRPLDWQRAHIQMRRARYALEQGEWKSAQTYAVNAAGQFHALIGKYKGDPDYEIYESLSSVFAAQAQLSMGHADLAVRDFAAGRDSIERSYKRTPQDSGAIARLLLIRETEARTYAAAQQCSNALSNMADSLRVAREAVSWDNQSLLGQEMLAATLESYGSAQLRCGAPKPAQLLLRQSVEIRQRLASHDPSNVAWNMRLRDAQALLDK